MKKTNPIFEIRGYDAPERIRVLSEADVMNFLVEVHDRMEAEGVTAAELGRRIGASRSQVSRWLRNDGGINGRTLFLLARGLGFELELVWRPVVDDRYESSYEEVVAPMAATAYSVTFDETVHLAPRELYGVARAA